MTQDFQDVGTGQSSAELVPIDVVGYHRPRASLPDHVHRGPGAVDAQIAKRLIEDHFAASLNCQRLQSGFLALAYEQPGGRRCTRDVRTAVDDSLPTFVELLLDPEGGFIIRSKFPLVFPGILIGGYRESLLGGHGIPASAPNFGALQRRPD